MSDLRNQTPSTTYKGLLQVNDYSNGVDATSKFVQDGEGTNSALSISTTKVGVGTSTPSAPLDVTSTTGGVVFPRLTTSQRDLINSGSPTDGETIFNTTTNQVESYNGSAWVAGGTTVVSNNAVTSDSITTDAVITSKIADNAVTSAKISDTDTTLKVATSEVAVNDGQGAVDFRVESNTADNLLLCDASENKVGIGTVPSGYKLDVQGSTTSSANSSVANLHASAAAAETVLLVKNDSATGEGARIALFNSNTSSYPNANKVAFVLESATPGLCVCFNTDAGATQATFKFLSDSNAFFVANTSSVPSTPTGGGVIYVEGGSLKYKGSSGTITTLGVA